MIAPCLWDLSGNLIEDEEEIWHIFDDHFEHIFTFVDSNPLWEASMEFVR